LADYLILSDQTIPPVEVSHKQSALTQKRESVDHAAQLLCQYPQKSTLGLFRIASATTRSTCKPFGSFR
jgi:hypothetical protein